VTADHFSDRLIDAVRAAGAPACVGLDPVYDKLPDAIRKETDDPVEAVDFFCRAVIETVAGICPVVKLQSACFERDGVAGLRILRDLVRIARARGLVVLLDAKRGDIGLTARHYAVAAFGSDHQGADAVTVSGYLGPDTIEPFLEPGRGVFVLVRTSNPGSDAVQALKLEDGRTVAQMMADHVAALGKDRIGRHGYSDVGAVVAATKPQDGAALRARMRRQVFLVPGYGAQGGTADDIRPLLDGRPECGGGVLVTASRSVIYAFEPSDPAWTKAVARAALKFVDEIRAVVS
jgi:orotidine-5'-phosphate decarboxylase